MQFADLYNDHTIQRLIADPSVPADNEVWFNLTENVYKKNFISTIDTSNATLVYASENDTNGLISWLGTNGGNQTFEAPAANASGDVELIPTTLCSSNLGGGDLVAAARGTIDRADQGVHSANASDQWYKFALPADVTLIVDHVSVRDRLDSVQNNLKNFEVQGSTDDSVWDTLATNSTIIGQGLWRQFDVTSSTPYKYFRLLSTGLNSQNFNYLSFCEFEFYGEFYNGVLEGVFTYE